MAKRKTFIELQNKPENREVRNLIEKPKSVGYAPLGSVGVAAKREDNSELGDLQEGDSESQKRASKKSQSPKSGNGAVKNNTKTVGREIQNAKQPGVESESESSANSSDGASDSIEAKRNEQTGQERLRIFQTSSPHTRAVTQYHKAAIVVRSEGGRQTIELAWRDQMNEKTRDIWDYLVKRFNEAAELDTNEILIRKRDVLENSGVKSDRTFIGAIYTLEDMELIRVRRLSGNKEGNVYVLTEEGREEIESYQKLKS